MHATTLSRLCPAACRTGATATLRTAHRPPACAGHSGPRLPQPRHPTLAASATSPRTEIDANVASEDDEEDLEAQLTAEELAMARSSGGGEESRAAGAPPPAPPPAEDDAEAWDDDGVEDEAMDDDEAWAAAAAAADDASPSSPPDLAAAADPADAAARDLALALAAAAASTKAGDVTVLHVAPLVYWTSYLVLATVYSRPQLAAVLAKAEDAAAAPPHARDLSGSANPGKSSWEALDFGDVVLHVLTPAQREFYDIDGFYGAAAEVPLPEEGSGAGAGGGEWARRL